MQSGEDTDEEDDGIVQELDVYLSKSLCGQLYLLQYPVQNASRKYGTSDRSVARIKPKNEKIEMEVAMDISSPNYDQSKGEQIALNVDGNSSTTHTQTFETNVMDKQTLESTSIPCKGKRYVTGVIQNDEIHLTPISKVLQLRPSFKYMDRAEHRASQAAKAKAAAEADSSQDEVEDAKAVTVRFKGAETEAARLARERSYAAYEKRLAEEKWITTKFHHKNESYAERERQRLICPDMKNGDLQSGGSSGFSEMVQTPSQYLTSLVPVYSEHELDRSCLPNNVLSISLLKNESFSDQLKLLMKNAKIIHFSHLVALLPNPPDVSTVVRNLQSYAVLVNGCWIAKSDVLFPVGTLSPITGIPSESLCKARDYILYLFTKSDYLVRREVSSTMKIPSDEVKAIFEDIAVMQVGRGWRLRLEKDMVFMKRFPEVCERQNMLWAALGSKLARNLNITNHAAGDPGGAKSKPGNDTVTPPRRKKNSSGDPQVAKQQAKTASKRQRKTSVQKSSPPKPIGALKTVKIKTEPHSETSTSQAPVQSTPSADTLVAVDHPASVLTQHPRFLLSPQPGEHSSTTVPIEVNHDLAASPKINLAGVKSTVELIANQMRQIGNSPPQQQYFIPQMSISQASLQHSRTTPALHLVQNGSNQEQCDDISNNVNSHGVS